MANKQIVDYIKEAQASNLKKGEIISNLKQAGWADEDIRDGFSYINLYSDGPFGAMPKTSARTVVAAQNSPVIRAGERWISLAAAGLGFVWLISGLNKVLSHEFVPGFSSYLHNQIESGQELLFYKNFLTNFALPNATALATLIQYCELAVGAALILAGLWNAIRTNKAAIFILCLASVGSFLLILNIIFSLGLPLPWVDTQNIFAPGVSVEYLVLILSVISAVAHFYEI